MDRPRKKYILSAYAAVSASLLWMLACQPKQENAESTAIPPVPDPADASAAVLPAVAGVIQPFELDPDAPVDFNFHVKPILSDNCFACHGFDEAARASGLRLDTFEGATENYAPAGEQAKYAIVPGEPENSELWKRINHSNPELLMPPITSIKDELTSEEKSIIRRWIEQGAEYKQHWAYIPPEKPEIPETSFPDWPRNDIDAFILEKLEDLDVRPSPEADKETLIRRVSLDLTGLPPSPAEVDAFLADTSPDAYERLVERLLASPHYGERMAIDWLDAARYGDTNVHHVDLKRTSWPWRDWVIDAFNNNKPYDTFIIEQMAGDLLDKPTTDQILATSFNRHHPITNEGGVISEEYLIEYASDRVHTVATAFLGMSMACTKCHDHKYDPYSMEDYYGMLSFFNSIPEIGKESQDPTDAYGYAPFMRYPTDPEDAAIWEKTKAEMARLYPEINEAAFKQNQSRLVQIHDLQWAGLKSATREFLRNGRLARGPRNVNFSAPGSEGAQKSLYEGSGRYSFDVSLDRVAPESDLLLLDVSSLDFKRVGKSKSSPLGYEVAVTRGISLEVVSGDQQNAETVFPVKIIDFWTSESRAERADSAANAFDSSPETEWKLKAGEHPLVIVLQLDRALPAKDKKRRLRLHLDYGENGLPFIQNNSFKVFAAKSPRPLDELLKAYAPHSLAYIAPENTRAALENHFRFDWAVSQNEADPENERTWLALQNDVRTLEDRFVRVAVMQENPEPTPTFVHDRGAYDKPLADRPVTRQIPTIFGKMNPEYPPNRLGFALWITEPDNPLTARVTVNRYWQMIFGTGLVKTSEEFGAQGELPSHPELLDYLATSFVESGWDTKALMRNIVTSATYRQQSVYRPEMEIADPENRFLSWFPRMRLPAELIRDNALAASGLLVPKIGGPSVKPYQPDGLWRERTMRASSNTGTFKKDQGEDLYRRGLYTFWKQTAAPPQMEAFDAPTREVCIVKRNTTNTPMQAMVLLNDETYLEAARKMASRVMDEIPGEWSESLDRRVSLAYRYLTGKTPSESSLDILRSLTLDAHTNFGVETGDPLGFLSYGDSPRNEALDPVEHAALAFTASAMLNLDKTITRD